ncbi:hypothetical protein [Gluconobacter japonicus]|uniref:hypothetical protein n=1 Tax=Gluconobacter japonicus TaxID=376620 RepID=UPI001B8CD391|nr:hypothetical protein [Gluconobacter japonicus]MBS1050471.1 hypothetical protein [Gluconobacter japonicus]
MSDIMQSTRLLVGHMQLHHGFGAKMADFSGIFQQLEMIISQRNKEVSRIKNEKYALSRVYYVDIYLSSETKHRFSAKSSFTINKDEGLLIVDSPDSISSTDVLSVFCIDSITLIKIVEI